MKQNSCQETIKEHRCKQYCINMYTNLLFSLLIPIISFLIENVFVSIISISSPTRWIGPSLLYWFQHNLNLYSLEYYWGVSRNTTCCGHNYLLVTFPARRQIILSWIVLFCEGVIASFILPSLRARHYYYNC